MITALVVLLGAGVLVWGFLKARPFGKLGILSWLQSVALMVPWLVFFALFGTGIYLNLAGILLLLLTSTGLYIFLGNRLRAAAQDTDLSRSLEPGSGKAEGTTMADATSTATDATPPPNSRLSNTASLPPDVLAIPDADLKAIQGIFGVDTFFATETFPYQEGAIFRGNLRGEPEASYTRLSRNLQERLGDRYRLFLVENQEGKPIVIVQPATTDPRPATVFQKIFALVLLLATLATTLEATSLLVGFDFFNAPSRWQEVLPLSLGIIAVLAAHEIGHQLMARRHQVRLSLPFFIPTWQIGSFGALTRFESLVPNRKILFDVAFAGPAASGLVSLGMLLAGLWLSHSGSLFQVRSEYFRGSVLVGTLARLVLGDQLQQPMIAVHPLTMLGWIGLVITALNLMPAGQLDGGRIVQAIYGRKTAGRLTIATLLTLGVASLVNPLALYWAIVILVLQRDLERPSLNELIEPDDRRAALGLLVLFLMIATLLPWTPSLAERLGIGG